MADEVAPEQRDDTEHPPSKIEEGCRVDYTVEVAEESIPDTVLVKAITVEFAVNRIARVTIDLADGDPGGETFTETSTGTFTPGSAINISLGWGDNTQSVFQGEITGLKISLDEKQTSAQVECKDSAVAMTIVRFSQTFTQRTEASVLQQIIGKYSKLQANINMGPSQEDATPLPVMQQYDATDWDFVLTRAEANSLVVTCVNNQVNVFSPVDPSKATSPVLTIDFGDDLLSSELTLNSTSQFNQVTTNSWDYSQQQLNSNSVSNSEEDETQALNSQQLSEAFDAQVQLQTSATLSQEELQAWGNGQMVKSQLNRLVGEISFQGTAQVQAGDYIFLGGVGKDMDGNLFVSGVRHEVKDGNWVTFCTLGLDTQWFAAEPDVMTPPAAGLLPGIQGLFNARVLQVYGDATGEYRVLVDIPLFNVGGQAAEADSEEEQQVEEGESQQLSDEEENAGEISEGEREVEAAEESADEEDEAETGAATADQNAIWARIANFYSSNGFGAVFLPEVGDEVIVGFVNDDPRHPVILGSLYSQSRAPFNYLTPEDNNPKKGIVTASGLRLLFDDQDEALSVITPNNNLIILDDSQEKITVQDQHKNLFVMSKDGIDINSPNTINIQAQEKINIAAGEGVFVQAGAMVGEGEMQTMPGDTGDSEQQVGKQTQVIQPVMAPEDSPDTEPATATMTGPMVNISATENLSATAEGETSVEGGANLKLKADLVEIN